MFHGYVSLLEGRGLKKTNRLYSYMNPRHPVILSDNDWGVQSPPKCIVFNYRLHCHSQKVIGSLGGNCL